VKNVLILLTESQDASVAGFRCILHVEDNLRMFEHMT